MNNKNNDTELITAEKIQNNYPQITLVSETSTKLTENSSNDCAPKTPAVQTTKIPVTTSSVTKLNIPIIKKTASPATDRKIPPYVNAFTQDPLRASKIPAQKPTFVKTPPKQTSEKGTGTVESAVTSLQTSPSIVRTPAAGDVKKSQNTQPVRANIFQTVPKPADKVVVSSTTISADETKSTSVSEGEHKYASPVQPTRSPQIQRTSDPLKKSAFEKSIDSNTITFTSRTINRNSPSAVKVIPSKDTKTAETNTVVSVVSISKSATTSPSTPKSTVPKTQILSTGGLCKSVSIQSKDSAKVVNVSRIVSATNSPKSDTANSKPQTVEPTLKTVPKVVVVTSADTSVRTKSPSLNVPSFPKIQTNESLTAPPAPIIKPTKPNLASGNLQIMSLSEVENNEDILKAINSGSTASVGKNVTISSASVENTNSTLDSKIRNVSSETTIETIAKQLNNPGSPAQKNKNGNPTEGVGQSFKPDSTPNSRASSPGESLTPKRNEIIPGLTERGEKMIDIVCPLKKKIDEPVECLTISSDEETEPDQVVSSDHSEVSVSILNKEPPIERADDASNRSSNGSAMEKEIDTMLETSVGEGFLNLNCRTVRIGSYKIIPKNGVTLSQFGLKIVVPPLNNSNDSVAVKIPIHDIAKVLVHYNRSLPVIFYYITPQAGAKIRHLLKMNDPNGYYFDPNSNDESHRRITLLPEKFSEEDRCMVSNYYSHRDVIEELTHTEANQLLVRSAPQDIQKTVRLPPNPVQTIMVYPPPPVKGGISINTEDYSCLAEDTYLNDVIIDFYLKYLYHEKLSEEDRQKTHIFSSFFYKRLTDKATPVPRMLQNSKSSDITVTPAEIRHDRVKKWTKNIDIFSKDYIVIPLNENQHWFLAIICFPGLAGPVRFSDNTPIDLESSKKTAAANDESSKSNENEPDSSQTRRIGSTTITPVRKEAYTVADEDGDVEDRDEASGADEDVDELFSSDEDSDELYSEPEPGEAGPEETPILKKKPEREPIKQPCILIFDSLKSASRARIIATLREYLHVEYKTKHGEERDFSKNVVKGACPRVPQQTNYTDCGLYVLQYVEMFFESKITDFHIPIRTLSRWFNPEIVSRKRYFIQRLLLELMEQQKINVSALQLPELHLSPDHYSHQYDSDEEMDYEDGYYDEEDDDSSNLGHLVGYDEEEMEISEHEYRIRQRLEAEGIEYMEEDEDGAVHSRFAMFDSGDESSSNDDFSDDDDDAYKGLEEMPHVVRIPPRQRRTLISVTRGGDGADEEEEILQEEEEDIEEEEEAVAVEEDEIKLNNLNKETVTISRMPASSGVVAKANQSDEGKRSTTIDELMNARPWKKLNEVSIERATEEDCPNKKFKTN